MKNLNKENFWNALHDKHPQAVDKFCKWIDQYKLEVGWEALFGNCFPTQDKIKFHDIPFDMQRGILTRFFEEVIDNEYPRHKQQAIEGITEFFEALDESIKTNRWPAKRDHPLNHKSKRS